MLWAFELWQSVYGWKMLKESHQDFSTVSDFLAYQYLICLDIDRPGPPRLSKNLSFSFTHQGHWSFHCFRESRYGRGWKVCFAMAVAVGVSGCCGVAGDPCSPLWTQNFSAFRSRVTHESQGCSLAVSEWKKSEKWREGKDFMGLVMKVDGWCSEILWRLLTKKLPTLTCGINRINCQTIIYPTLSHHWKIKTSERSAYFMLNLPHCGISSIVPSLPSEVWSCLDFLLPKEVSPSSTTQTEILCQVSLPLPALPLEGKSTLATLHASCHIRHGRCHAGHGIHSTHWSRIHRSLSKAFGSSFRCHRSSFALTLSRTSGTEKLSEASQN